MNVLDRKEFIARKKSDTIIVYGCGNSINSLSDHDKEQFSRFDSIAFNWFCKSSIPTTFYVVREQANTQKRRSEGENVEDIVSYLNNESYIDSCLIIHKVKRNVRTTEYGPVPIELIFYEDHLDLFDGSGVVVKDLKHGNVGLFVEDIFKMGVYHGRCTMNNVMHIVKYLKYRDIIFVGVDLYDSRYFWLEDNQTRNSVKLKGHNYTTKHAISNTTIDLTKSFKRKFPEIRMHVHNPRSLLTKIMPVWISK